MQSNTMHRTLFIIPARGGSKGIPRKNLCLVGNIPIIGRVILAARKTLHRLGNQGDVVVSTDCPEIAQTAERFGAEIPCLRPQELAQDDSPTLLAAIHMVQKLREQGRVYTEVILLQPTVPLVLVSDILGSIDKFRRGDGAPVIAMVRPSHGSNWLFRMDDAGHLFHVTPQSLRVQRQSLDEEFDLAGSVYVSTAEWIEEQPHWLVPGRTRGYVVSDTAGIDIDTSLDLHIANEVWKRRLPWERNDRVMVIAEAGVNHNGDMGRAFEMIDAAADVGADAIKFQLYHTSELVAKDAPQADYQRRNTGKQQSMDSLIRKLELSCDQLGQLAARSRERNLQFSASVFDDLAVEELDRLEPDFIKIPSGEVTNIPLLEAVGRLYRPVILSTGMCTLAEAATAVHILTHAGSDGIAVLQCTSDYPAAPSSINLRAMQNMEQALSVPVGLSDHSTTFEIAAAAVGMGARIIEKHFTIDRTLPGPDHASSFDVEQLRQFIQGIRNVEAALGTSVKSPHPSELDTARVARKSIVARHDLASGTHLTLKDLALKRPGTGYPPSQLPFLVGLTLTCDVKSDTILTPEMFR